MARPQKNKIEYFPHPVTHGKKMSYMEKIQVMIVMLFGLRF